jgi:hypothetical protein
MNITQASALIAAAFASGLIDAEKACNAHKAIRDRSYYGKTMSNDDRRRMLANRFGISA